MDSYFVPTKSSKHRKSYECVVHERRPKHSVKNNYSAPSVNDGNIRISEKIEHASSAEKYNNSECETDEILRERLSIKEEQKLERKKEMFEVYKFVQASLKGSDHFKSDKELAVRLGAVRPKASNINYKILKQELEDFKKNPEKPHPLLAGTKWENFVKQKPEKEDYIKKRRVAYKKGDVGGLLTVYGKVAKNKPTKRKSRK